MFNILALVGGAPARLAGVCEAGPGETRDEEGKRLTASQPDVFGVTTKGFSFIVGWLVRLPRRGTNQ